MSEPTSNRVWYGIVDAIGRCVQLSTQEQARLQSGEGLSLVVDLGFDSLRFVQLIVEIERQFGVKFADGDLSYDTLDRVDRIAEFVERIVM